MSNITPEIQKMGAQSTGKNMTAEQKKERAREASIARWKKKKGVDYVAPLPEAAYRGSGFLGDENVECYVLTDGSRVVSSSQALRLLTGSEDKKAKSIEGAGILKISALKSLSISEDFDAQSVSFHIPGNPTIAEGVKAEMFAEICSAFVTAGLSGDLKTPRQREIAMRCAIYQKSFMKIGIVAYIDELTHYQDDRKKNEIDIKVKAYIQEEARKWEKAFPDLLYQELARLSGYPDWKSKPSWYGHVTNRIYKMVDPVVAEKIKELAKDATAYRHQFLTKDAGLLKLRDSINQAIGLARTCATIQEFNQKMKLFEEGGTYQMSFPFNKSLLCVSEK